MRKVCTLCRFRTERAVAAPFACNDMASVNHNMVRSTGSMKVPIQWPTGSKSLSKDRGGSREKEGIHSGHFMVSRVHGNTSGDYLSDEEKELDQEDEKIKRGYNFSDASKDTCKEYKFGNRSTQTLAIDESLSHLFQHLTLAYSGKITSPKWKQFRGMHMNVKDKIRVNNIIWREWHMQYVFGRKPRVCHFATPLQELTHNKPEVAVVEGYYWKRRLDTIANEYKRWRKFYRHKHLKAVNQSIEQNIDETSTDLLLQRVGEMTDISCFPRQQQTSHTDLLLNTNDLQEMMDLSESLFSNLRQPFDFPNPRELAGYGYGDFLQPGLLQFQPSQTSFDEFMDFESLPDYWSSKSSSSSASASTDAQPGPILQVPSLDMETATSPLDMPQSPSMMLAPQIPPFSHGALFDNQATTLSPVSIPSPGPVGDVTMETDLMMAHLQQLQQKKLEKKMHEQKQLEEQLKQQQEQQKKKQQQEQISALLQHPEALKILLVSSGNAAIADQVIQELQTHMQLQQRQQQLQQQKQLEQQQRLQQQQQQQLQQQQQQERQIRAQAPTQKPLQPTPSQSNTVLLKLINNKVSCNSQTKLLPTTTIQQQQQQQQPGAKPKSSNNIGTTNILDALSRDESFSKKLQSQTVQNSQLRTVVKKDPGGFIIPQGEPVSRTRDKNRPLAPNMPVAMAVTQASSNNSFLAQLLTTGTYLGAVPLKDDRSSGIAQLHATPIRALPAHQSQLQTTTINVSDFPTSLLLAAVNRAVGPNQVSATQVLQTASKQGINIQATMPVMTTTMKMETSVSPSSVPASTETCGAMSPRLASEDSSFDDSFTIKNAEALFAEMDKNDTGSENPLSADKKRRNNIKSPGQIQKSGFDVLHTLIPSLRQSPTAKVSKAAMLQKTAEYCKKLKAERSHMQKEADILKTEISALNQAISICQSQLPATGVPVTRQRANQMRDMFEDYVKQRTLNNWKFWIFSLIIDKLFETYNTMVSTASIDELCRTVLAWLDQHCSLPSLRPIVSDAMRHLSTTTSILSDPARVPEQAAQAVIKRQKHMSGDGGT